MRVRVALSKEAAEEASFRNRPFMLGLLVTPLGAIAGTLALRWSGSAGLGASHLPSVVTLGAIVGSIYALPVTVMLFPLMHRARVAPLAYQLAGAFVGLVAYGAHNPFFALPATVGGFVTGLVFALVNRRRPARPEDAAGAP